MMDDNEKIFENTPNITSLLTHRQNAIANDLRSPSRSNLRGPSHNALRNSNVSKPSSFVENMFGSSIVREFSHSR